MIGVTGVTGALECSQNYVQSIPAPPTATDRRVTSMMQRAMMQMATSTGLSDEREGYKGILSELEKVPSGRLRKKAYD